MDLSGRARSDKDRLPWAVGNHKAIFRAVIALVVGGFIVLGLVLWITGRFELETVGYPGVWVFSFISSASIIVPVPGLATVCLGASDLVGLNPILVGVIAGSAEALGELTGYLAGVGGRDAMSRRRWYPRVKGWLERHGSKIIFVMAIVPNPTFDILGIAAGSIGFPLRRFLLVTFLAKSIKSVGLGYACFYSIAWLERLI